jgi:hypothetical protein
VSELSIFVIFWFRARCLEAESTTGDAATATVNKMIQ